MPKETGQSGRLKEIGLRGRLTRQVNEAGYFFYIQQAGIPIRQGIMISFPI